MKVLSFMGERYQPSYYSKTKCLVLESELERSEFPGIANLLWRLHDLEILIIKLFPDFYVSTIAFVIIILVILLFLCSSSQFPIVL